MRKIIISIVFLMLTFVLFGQTAVIPASGDGSENNPYQVESWQNLYWIAASGIVNNLTQADRWSKHYIQTADIDFANASPAINTWNNGMGWPTIGIWVSETDTLPFIGSYNGNHKTISNLFINNSSSAYQGLFGLIYRADITNLGLVNANVTGQNVGALVSFNSGVISNCFSSGTITSSGNGLAGGLVAINDKGMIINSYSTANVTGIKVGGLVGFNWVGVIINSSSSGNVSGGSTVSGGLVGKNDGVINKCYSTSNVLGTNVSGGLVGKNLWVISECYSTGNVTGNSSSVGGLVGQNSAFIINCFWDIENSNQASSSGGTGKTTAEMKMLSTFVNVGWNFSYPWQIETNNYPTFISYEDLNINGIGSESSPYEISNLAQLLWFGTDNTVWTKHFKQTEDISFPEVVNTWDGGKGWLPIGMNYNVSPNEYLYLKWPSFIYDGNNKTISGLYSKRLDNEYVGFFSYLPSNSSEIKNLTLTNLTVIGNYNHTGGLVGSSNANIDNCYCYGNVTGLYYTGGLVGGNEGTINNSHFSGTVTGSNNVGGLVGRTDSTINNCTSEGTINGQTFTGGLVGLNYYATITNSRSNTNTSGNTFTGGLVGENLGQLTNCGSSGVLTGNSKSGGLVGFNDGYASIHNSNNTCTVTGNEEYTGGLVGDNAGTIINSYSEAVINGKYCTGGLIGVNTGTISFSHNNGTVTGTSEKKIGGLVGYNYSNGTINNSYNQANVTGIDFFVGGLTGYNSSTINNSYNTGSVSSYDYVGGVTGCNNSGTITNCYSAGVVISSLTHVGGLIALNDQGAVNASFWDTDSSGQTASVGGIGKTTAEMKNIITYTNSGWSFPDVWLINPEMNDGYPYLNHPSTISVDDIDTDTDPVNHSIVLNNAYPNPFNPCTTLSFVLSTSAKVKLDIYNVKGQLVKSLVNGYYNSGKHEFIWNGKDKSGNTCGTGVYFYKILSNNIVQTKKMMLIK